MNDKFIIPLNGLTAGENEFSWQAGREFFESFENTEVIDAQLDIEAFAEKSGRYIGVGCRVQGSLVVECDRCLEDLTIPVDVDVELSVKFGEAVESEEVQDDGREVIFVPVENTELDLSQIIYDYVCTSLPMQRVHPEGECNSETMKYYEGSVGVQETSDGEGGSSPFAALKDMFR